MKAKSPASTAARKAVRLLGGPVKVAKRFGLPNYQTVQQWCRNGVPTPYCTAVEKALEGRVMRWDLRPEDWWRVWEDLIGQPGAPEVAESGV